MIICSYIICLKTGVHNDRVTGDKGKKGSNQKGRVKCYMGFVPEEEPREDQGPVIEDDYDV